MTTTKIGKILMLRNKLLKIFLSKSLAGNCLAVWIIKYIICQLKAGSMRGTKNALRMYLSGYSDASQREWIQEGKGRIGAKNIVPAGGTQGVSGEGAK